jgi:hypothetical protein
MQVSPAVSVGWWGKPASGLVSLATGGDASKPPGRSFTCTMARSEARFCRRSYACLQMNSHKLRVFRPPRPPPEAQRATQGALGETNIYESAILCSNPSRQMPDRPKTRGFGLKAPVTQCRAQSPRTLERAVRVHRRCSLSYCLPIPFWEAR